MYVSTSNGIVECNFTIIDNQFNMTSNSATHDKISAGDENKEQPYYIGGWGGIAHPGSFYDYRHYDRVLSDAEIVKIYTKGTTFGDEVTNVAMATIGMYGASAEATMKLTKS